MMEMEMMMKKMQAPRLLVCGTEAEEVQPVEEECLERKV